MFSYWLPHRCNTTAEGRTAGPGLDLYIGINGCSLKTEENLKVMAQVRHSAVKYINVFIWDQSGKSSPLQGFFLLQGQSSAVLNTCVAGSGCV